jgi:two-component system response regulator RegX3
MKYDCLIIDDEEALSESTKEYFNMFGVKTHWVPDQNSCKNFLKEHTVDIILLDINLGDDSGFELCKHLRETIDIPILFISARTGDDDVLLALNVGGDDYIQKPYSLAVLLAKVTAVLKRHRAGKTEEELFIHDKLKVDFTNGFAYYNGKKTDLRTMEFKLLAYLIKNRNRTVTKEEIFRNVWEDSFTGDNTLNVHIRYIRERIEPDPKNPTYIKTIWGVGYIFEVRDIINEVMHDS